MINESHTNYAMKFDGDVSHDVTQYDFDVTKVTRDVVSNQDPAPHVEFANLYPAVVQCFAIILCGYAAGRFNIISQTEAKGLNTFVSYFSLPALIFLSLSQLDFSSVNWLFLLAICLAKAVVFLLVSLVTLLVNRPTNYSKAGLYAIFCTQSNDFALGYPLLEALYGTVHPEFPSYLYLLAPVSLVILNPLGFILLEIGKRTSRDAPSRPSSLSRSSSSSSLQFRPSPVEEDASNDSSQPDHSLMSKCVLAGQILKGILLNPVVAMTILGVFGNILFKHQLPDLMGSILKVLGNAFSASALFALGVRMVGKVATLRGSSLVVPGILITIKTLMLPLVAREFVSILKPGGAFKDVTEDFSNFGFLYGTFPTAPSVFVFASHYNVEADMIATSMVAVTFLSAPFMLLSAKMITLVNINPLEYVAELENFLFNISTVGVVASIWVLLVFLCGRKWKIVPHSITLCLIIAQLMAAFGAMLWTYLDCRQPWQLYLQFTVVTWGVFASRFFTALLAATLFLMRWKSMQFVLDSRRYIVAIGWGVPGILVLILLFVVQKEMHEEKQQLNFQYGTAQAVIALLLLWFSLFTTIVCLILLQRQQRRYDRYSTIRNMEGQEELGSIHGPRRFHDPSSEETDQDILISSDSSDSLFNHNDDLNSRPVNNRSKRKNKKPGSVSVRSSYEAPTIVENLENSACMEVDAAGSKCCAESSKEDLVDVGGCISNGNDAGPSSITIEQVNGATSHHGASSAYNRLPTRKKCSTSARPRPNGRVLTRQASDLTLPLESNLLRDRDDEFQIMRHVVMLLILCASMMVGFGLCLWTLVTEEVSGVYVEMVFLDGILNYGQSIFTAIVFGFDIKMIVLPLLRWYRRIIHGDSCVNLPSPNDLPIADKQICEQFTRYHMDKCIRDIVRDRRWRLRRLTGVFGGQDFVDWLLLVGLAHDRTHAVRYGRALLAGRVIKHSDSMHHFHDQPLFYTFTHSDLRASFLN